MLTAVRRPGRLLSLAAAVTFVVVPAVVVETARPAEAFVNPAILVAGADALEVGGAAAAGGAAVAGGEAATVGLVCATGVGCAVLAGVAVAGLAYSTRDYWLPYVKNWMAGGPEGDGQGAPGGACTASVTWATQPVPTNGGTAPTISIVGAPACDGWKNLKAYVTRVCQATDGTITTAGEAVAPAVIPGSTTTGSFTACGSGKTPIAYQAKANPAYAVDDGNVSGHYPDFNHLVWTNPSTGVAPDATTTTTTVRCVNSGTGTTTDVALSGPGSKGIPMPSCAALGPGWGTQSAKTTQCVSATGTSTVPICQTVLDVRPDGTRPGCTAGTPCTLSVWHLGHKCTASDAGCVDWASGYATAPGDYQCHLGAYVVPMGYCSVLEFAYGDAITVTDPALIDGDPTTPSTRPAPLATATSSPTTTSTVTSSPTATTSPEPSPSTSSSTSAAPLPTSGTYPTGASDPIPAPDPSADPSGRGCLGAAWSWNPVDWVMVPVQCALRWAFVPRADVVQTQIDGIRGDLAGTTPGVWVTAFGGLGAAFHVSEAGCQGPALDLSGMGLGAFRGVVGTIYPFSACSGVMATVAAVVKTLLTLSVTVFGALACVRALGSGFGWSPAVGDPR